MKPPGRFLPFLPKRRTPERLFPGGFRNPFPLPKRAERPVVEQESAVSAGSDAMDVSEPASRVPAPEAVETTEPREGADGEEETSEQASSDETDGKLPSTEEDAPVLEGESTPWTPQPKIIDPEADADEIPPLAGGRGAGGALAAFRRGRR